MDRRQPPARTDQGASELIRPVRHGSTRQVRSRAGSASDRPTRGPTGCLDAAPRTLLPRPRCVSVLPHSERPRARSQARFAFDGQALVGEHAIGSRSWAALSRTPMSSSTSVIVVWATRLSIEVGEPWGPPTTSALRCVEAARHPDVDERVVTFEDKPVAFRVDERGEKRELVEGTGDRVHVAAWGSAP